MKTIKVTKISKEAAEKLMDLGYTIVIVGWGPENAKKLARPLLVLVSQ